MKDKKKPSPKSQRPAAPRGRSASRTADAASRGSTASRAADAERHDRSTSPHGATSSRAAGGGSVRGPVSDGRARAQPANKALEEHLHRRHVFREWGSLGPSTFSEENPSFFKWFREDVMRFDSDEYRREFWREVNTAGHTIGDLPYGFREYARSRTRSYGGNGVTLAVELGLLVGGAFAVWAAMRVVDRYLHGLRRPMYYEGERERRRALSAERRRIRRRRTLNKRPSLDAIREALSRAKDSPADAIRLGALLEDLECYVDNSLRFDGCGRIVGRRGGIRRYLQENAEDLYRRYKTLMRYKALSRRFRQAAGVADPIPADRLLPSRGAEAVRHETADAPGAAPRGCDAPDGAPREYVADEVPADGLSGARERAKEVLEACEGTLVSLDAQLYARLHPDYAPRIAVAATRKKPGKVGAKAG
jgi:hypothetical protein